MREQRPLHNQALQEVINRARIEQALEAIQQQSPRKPEAKKADAFHKQESHSQNLLERVAKSATEAQQR